MQCVRYVSPFGKNLGIKISGFEVKLGSYKVETSGKVGDLSKGMQGKNDEPSLGDAEASAALLMAGRLIGYEPLGILSQFHMNYCWIMKPVEVCEVQCRSKRDIGSKRIWDREDSSGSFPSIHTGSGSTAWMQYVWGWWWSDKTR